MNSLNRTQRFAALGISWTLGMALAVPGVLASPPEHVLERARQAVAEGQEAARGLENADAQGQDQKAKGLENAAIAIEAAATRKAEREGTDFPGQGKALGRGHADEVHSVLAAGGSPSSLASHGEAVRELAAAFDKVKADHPGLGKGLDKEKPAKGSDDGDEAEVESDDD